MERTTSCLGRRPTVESDVVVSTEGNRSGSSRQGLRTRGVIVGLKCLLPHALRVFALCVAVLLITYILTQIANMQHNFTALELAMARKCDTGVARALLKAGAYIDGINTRSLRPVFKDLLEASGGYTPNIHNLRRKI